MAFLLPSKHPKKLLRFARAAREVGTSAPGLVLINAADWERDPNAWHLALAALPHGWGHRLVPGTTYGDALREVWPIVKDFPWVGLVADDLVPASPNWDTQLLRHLQGWNFVTANDGRQVTADIRTARMHGATVFSGDLLRAVGCLFPDGLRHIFHDDFWETIGRETGAWQTVMDVLTRHEHEFYETGVRDATMDPASDLWKHDQAWFEAWRDGGAREAAVARVKALMESRKVKFIDPDLSAVKLLIATPCHSGRLEQRYVHSLWKTMAMLQAKRCSASVVEETHTADISLARSNLFSAFVRSDATHLLFIDDDMGWEPSSVLRLFDTGHDVVGIPGPKKRYPLTFAANLTDEHGNAVELPWHDESRCHEVGEVGAAFLLVSRRAADMMVAAYRDQLEFGWATGEKVWAMFLPMVDPVLRKWYSEDFAFCRRWRDIGGKVYICAEQRLDHVGAHVFSGCLAQLFKPPEAPALQEAAE